MEMHSAASGDAFDEFETAWVSPKHTTIEFPALDVNQVLQTRYTLDTPVELTRDQLWDMEIRKAWDPHTYIPYVVSEGRSWGRTTLRGGRLHHRRSSLQKAWISEESGRVLEEVVADPVRQRIVFLGRAEFPESTNSALRADPFQPLFHVEHGVGGTRSAPTNLWRIVVLTDRPDPRYQATFDSVITQGWLPGFLEIYVERDLGASLRRR